MPEPYRGFGVLAAKTAGQNIAVERVAQSVTCKIFAVFGLLAENDSV